ncbi:MAG TPA: IucA/IucC family protein, partial [Nannocystaceae bacterium]|nr:IucA/IucC family protein [Nannocystaceae bacterium]
VAARLALACSRERLIDATLEHGALRLGRGPTLPLSRVRALELHTPELTADRDPLLEDPLALWHALAPTLGLAPAVIERVASELADGAHNLALALVAVHWRRRLADRDPHDARVCDGEHVVVEGHPWHPMTKTRLGLRTSEVLRHAPEWLADVPLVAVDVPRALARTSGPWIETVAPIVGHPPAGLVRIPVHLAQWRRIAGVADLAAPLTNRGPVARARALLSVRTVAVPGSPLHLKLALDVHTTSARRIVSPMSVANGAPVTALLERIAARDPVARGEPALVVLGERAAAGLDPTAFGDAARQLGAIARDAHELARAPAMVCAALGDRWPDGTRGLERLAARGPGDPRERATTLVHAYIGGLVPPVLRMLVAHGVALEVHLQNTLVRSDGRCGLRFVVRDLGGIRLHRGRLAAAGHEITLDPASFITTDDLDELVGKLAHTLVHAHMAAFFGWVHDAFGVAEAEGWAALRATIAALLQRWSAEPGLAAACAHDRAALFARRCRAKALLSMRIHDRSSDYDWVELDNPLAEA